MGPSGTNGDPEKQDPRGSGSEQQRLTKGGQEPAEDDTLLLSYQQRPDTINGITASDTQSNAFQRQVYESLGEADYANPEEVLPSLATDWNSTRKPWSSRSICERA